MNPKLHEAIETLKTVAILLIAAGGSIGLWYFWNIQWG